MRSFYGRLAPSKKKICSVTPFEAVCHSKARSFVLRARDRRGCASSLASPLFTFSAFDQGRLTLLVVHSRVGVGQTTAWFCGLFVPTSSERKPRRRRQFRFSIGLPNSNSLELQVFCRQLILATPWEGQGDGIKYGKTVSVGCEIPINYQRVFFAGVTNTCIQFAFSHSRAGDRQLHLRFVTCFSDFPTGKYVRAG